MGEYEDNYYRSARGPALGLRASLFILLAVALMVADQRSSALETVRQVVHPILSPFEQLARVPGVFASWSHYWQSRDELLIQNTQLLHDELLLKARLQKLQALEAENEHLRSLLQSSYSIKQDVLVAEILDVSNDPYRQQIKINKGTADGIYTGQALIDAHGILGQVSRAFEHSSVAILITDPSSSIPVIINRNGLRTIARGQGTSLLSLPFLPGNADVQEGDLLVSSGMGGHYPAGYPVARITRLDDQPGMAFLSIQATPTAKLHSGRQVLLVVPRKQRAGAANQPGNQPAASGGKR